MDKKTKLEVLAEIAALGNYDWVETSDSVVSSNDLMECWNVNLAGCRYRMRILQDRALIDLPISRPGRSLSWIKKGLSRKEYIEEICSLYDSLCLHEEDVTLQDLMALWGICESAARRKARKLVGEGVLCRHKVIASQSQIIVYTVLEQKNE